MGTNVKNPTRRPDQPAFVKCVHCGAPYTVLGITRHTIRCRHKKPVPYRISITLEELRFEIMGTRGDYQNVVFLPHDVIKSMTVADVGRLYRRLWATGTAPVLAMRQTAEYDRSLFKEVVVAIDDDRRLVRVTTPGPGGSKIRDLSLEHAAYYNLFDKR